MGHGRGRTGCRLLAVAASLALVAGLMLAGGRIAGAAPSPGTTDRTSVWNDGTPGTASCSNGDGNCFYPYQTGELASSISADGRYVAFATPVRLDPLATPGTANIYVRDRNSPGHTVLISRGAVLSEIPSGTTSATTFDAPADAAGEAPADGNSGDPVLSADGRYVAFDTYATNIPDGDLTTSPYPESSDVQDVVICDRDPEGDGVLDKHRPGGAMDYRYVVVGRLDSQYGDRFYANGAPSIAADGSAIAWQQVPAATDGDTTDVLATLGKDAQGRLQPPDEDTYVDVRFPAADESIAQAGPPRLSADGRHVVFTVDYGTADADPGSYSVERPKALPGNGTVLYAEDCPLPGAGCDPATNEVDVDSANAPLGGIPSTPAISGDGSVIAFTHVDGSFADQYPCGATPAFTRTPVSQVVVLERDPSHIGRLGPGDGAPVRELVASATVSGRPGQGCSDHPALSADGRYLAFDTTADIADAPVDPDGAGDAGVVQRDLVVDQQRQAAGLAGLPAELASPGADPGCQEAQDPYFATPAGSSILPALDGNGGAVSFASCASNLVPGDTNDLPDLFVRQYRPTVSAAPLTFGTIAQGAAVQATVVVSQAGFGPITIGSVGISGPDAGDFSIFPSQTCQGATLYETGQCLVSIRYAPSGPGDRTAVLTLGTPVPVTVPLSGGSGPPINGFLATPDPLVFPGRHLALTPTGPEAILVTNTSAAPFTITAVTVLGGPGLFPGDYTITSDTCRTEPIPPAGQCVVRVLNIPHGAGFRPGALAFTDTTGGSPQVVGLSATGTTPTLRLSPAVLPAGRVTTVLGQGFPANYPVTVTTTDSADAPAVTATTNAAGVFSVGLPIFDHAGVGTRPVLGSAVNLPVSAGAPLLIVLGTYQPPGFTTRR